MLQVSGQRKALTPLIRRTGKPGTGLFLGSETAHLREAAGREHRSDPGFSLTTDLCSAVPFLTACLACVSHFSRWRFERQKYGSETAKAATLPTQSFCSASGGPLLSPLLSSRRKSLILKDFRVPPFTPRSIAWCARRRPWFSANDSREKQVVSPKIWIGPHFSLPPNANCCPRQRRGQQLFVRLHPNAGHPRCAGRAIPN